MELYILLGVFLGGSALIYKGFRRMEKQLRRLVNSLDIDMSGMDLRLLSVEESVKSIKERATLKIVKDSGKRIRNLGSHLLKMKKGKSTELHFKDGSVIKFIAK